MVKDDLLRADLVATRERGYAIDDEESTEGVRCFAFAVGDGRPRTHAISCSIPVARLSPDLEDLVVKALREAAASLAEPDLTGLFTT